MTTNNLAATVDCVDDIPVGPPLLSITVEPGDGRIAPPPGKLTAGWDPLAGKMELEWEFSDF